MSEMELVPFKKLIILCRNCGKTVHKNKKELDI